MTRAEVLAEQYSDWRWRLNNLYKILTKEGEEIPFRMNWAQERLWDEMHFRNIILKARQLGFTTFICLFMLDRCIWVPNVRAGLIAHNQDDAAAFFKDKVKFPYDQLDEAIRAFNPATEDSAKRLSFRNNSSLRVGTSLRSGTLQYLHISEYGKICAKYPEKAREVKTGALNTVAPGQVVFVESTAEGQSGDFYEMCERGQTLTRTGAGLTEIDYKFMFFPWWENPEYVLYTDEPIPADIGKYFKALLYDDYITARGVTEFTHPQQAWYWKTAEIQGADMKREFPSTPKEAFEAAVEGAYYANEIAKAEKQGRIGTVLHDDALPVDVWWDLGVRDPTTMWFVQRAGHDIRFIDYYHSSGEGFAHYARVLRQRGEEEGYFYGRMVWPHDGNHRIQDEFARRKSEIWAELWGEEPDIVDRPRNKKDGIDVVRSMWPRFWIDKTKCAEGLKGLKAYRKEWDDRRGCWSENPYHDWASDPADGVMTGCYDEGGPQEFRKINYPKLPIV